MTRKTQDSVVVVTGAGSGIGRATVLACAAKGAAVALAATCWGVRVTWV